MPRLRRATSRDVAEAAGVSRTTVSFVLNEVTSIQIPEETRRRVREAARRLGYYPDASARSLASQRSDNSGVLLCRSTVHLPAQLLGRTAAEILMRQITGENVSQRTILLDTHLVIRQSA